METPSASTRKVTLSRTNNSNSFLLKKGEGSEEVGSKSRQRNSRLEQRDRSALIDITNDSPIVGLAMGNHETPSSAISKQKRLSSQPKYNRTPGSGEAILRSQVKTLLQKVEEEAELSRTRLDKRPFFSLQDHLIIGSPIKLLLAPTPANTPEVLTPSAHTDALPSVSPFSTLQISLMETNILDGTEVEGIESSDITRSLLLDFYEKSDKSEASDCGALGVDKETGKEKPSTDDDNVSIWSTQVNASSYADEEDIEDCLEEECDDIYSYADEEKETKSDYYASYCLLHGLCEGISKITIGGAPKFQGKHIRFVYDSDDELQGEEDVAGSRSPSTYNSTGIGQS